jgi:uncharacterized protein YtpQ (UPF0354 family)
MVRFLYACLVGVCVAGPLAAEPLRPGAFTDEIVRAVRQRLPNASVTVGGDLEFSIKEAGGRSATISLANTYKDYVRQPAALKEIVAAAAKAFSEPPRAKLDPSRIVPVIKDRAWIEDMRKQVTNAGKKPPEPLVDDFNTHLVIVYAEDTPARTRYLDAAEDLGLARADLRARALDNLRALLPKITLTRHPDGYGVLSAGGDYDASLLLLDGLWSNEQMAVEGDIVVAVPTRNALLVTGSRERKGLKAVRALVAALAQDPYHLTDSLFVRRQGRFVKFGRD